VNVARHASDHARRRLRVTGSVGLVCVVAAVVALLLAQSAGAVHLGLLGPVG
jgi:hypothetical protein